MKAQISALALLACLAAPAQAAQGDVLVRLRGIMVSPTEESSAVLPLSPDATVSVDNSFVPEIDFTYFFTDNFAAELILATSPHDISGEGVIEGLGEIAEVMVLPPTLTLQYHFAPNAPIRPYIGAGINYTIFYSVDSTDSLNAALGPTSVDLEDSVSYAVQAGVDIDISDRFFLNADIKYIDVNTSAELNTGGAINSVDVDLDPIVAGIGIGVRF